MATAVKPQGCTNMKLRQLMRRVTQHYDAEVGKTGLKGTQYSLMVIREPEDHGKDLFVMFTDSTNRKETYPATRYVWVAPADSLGRTVVDFNKAFNPPCAFTKFATCPFPPKGNHLPLRIEGGEWNPHYGEPAEKAK